MAKLLRLALVGVLVLGVSVARADDKETTGKLVGTWEVIKADKGALPVGSTVEFIKGGKLKVTHKEEGKTVVGEGTYKVESGALKVAVKVEDKEHNVTLQVKTLTDKELVLANDKDQTATFKKK
jgi:uncharacterized protein (TIGR03066 family)